MQSNLVDFIQVLRSHEVRISPAETLDAVGVARHLGYADRNLLRDGLSMTLAKTPEEEVILVKADHRVHRIRHDELVYIEGLREYVTYWKKDGKIVALESLKKLEEKLPASQFMRVHKSYIINTSLVGSLYGNQVDVAGKLIPIGKSYRDEVLERLKAIEGQLAAVKSAESVPGEQPDSKL